MKAKECTEFNKCMEILHLILDDEADAEQQEYLRTHIEQCMVCFEQYEVEKELRVLIKTKIENIKLPDGLIDEIKRKTFYSA